MEGFKSFFKDTIIYGIASVLPRVITFGLVAVHTMVFQTNEFSFMTVWYVYAAFINVILTLGMETSFFRFYTAETNKKDVISTAYTILMVSSLIFLLIGFLFSDSLNSFFHFEDPRFLPLLMGTTVLDTLVVIPFAYLRVKGRPLRFMLVKLINIIALAIITILFLLIIPQYFADGSSTLVKLGLVPEHFKPEVVHIFYANVAASFITLLILLPELRYISIRIDKNICKKLINYGTPIMIGGIAYIINESADKLMIPKMIGENANGIYAASYKLGVFMVLYITAFRMGAEPYFFNNAATANAKEKYSKIMTWFVTFGSIFMVLVVALIDPLASILLRQKVYFSGLVIVPVILLANLFSGIYNNLAVWYKLTDKTRFGMYISIFGGLLTILSLWIFIPLWGILGAAYATLCTYFSMAVISWYFGKKYYKIPYELGKLSLIIIGSTAVSLVSFHFFRAQYFANFLLFSGYLGLLYLILKEDIKEILRQA